MRVLVFSIIVIFLSVGCNSEQKEIAKTLSVDSSKISSSDSETIDFDTIGAATIGKPYFDFDEVIHYTIDEKRVYKAENNAEAEYEKRLRVFLNGWRDGQMSDTLFWEDLESFKKNKKKINKVHFKKLNSEVFVNLGCGELSGFACIPIFRDILVFKKGGKLTGLAKICFQCEMSHFEGNKSNTTCFGTNTEFEVLHKLGKKIKNNNS